uniref:Uncharacterized protein n=1 Tax=Cannabis sativa TaxID=3483 RepID=A0A803QYP2_CANSA
MEFCFLGFGMDVQIFSHSHFDYLNVLLNLKVEAIFPIFVIVPICDQFPCVLTVIAKLCELSCFLQLDYIYIFFNVCSFRFRSGVVRLLLCLPFSM